jgi:hypothetical protein
MPLTRHLYEIDEVVSALQMCLCRNLPAALFWTWELVQSAEDELALNTLHDSWLRYGSGRDPTLLTVSPNEPADWCSLVMRVRFACRSHISTVLLLNDYSDKLIYPTTSSIQLPSPPAFLKAAASESIELKLATRIWKVLYNAVNTRNDKSAISVLQAMQPILSADTIWIAIEALEPTFSTLLRTHASLHPESQILHQAVALFIACTQTDERSATPADLPPVSHIQHSWDKWTAVAGKRAARVHEIPPAALHKETTRGRIPSRYTNIADIRDPIAELPQGCRWWREQTAALGIHLDEDGALVFPSDDVLENFYERHFPDDIPDEWSAKDQQKSHGRGLVETAPDPPPSIRIRESPVDQNAWILPCPVVAELSTCLSKL